MLHDLDKGGRRFRIERHALGQQLEQKHAQGKDVYGRVDLELRIELLGRGVSRRAAASSVLREVAMQRPCEPEVHYTGLAATIDEDIGRLEIAVDQVVFVNRRDRFHYSDEDSQSLIARSLAPGCCQVLAVDPLHDQKRRGALQGHFIDGAEIRMTQARHGSRLGEQLLAHHLRRFVRLRPPVQQLDRDASLQRGIGGCIYTTHAAAADAALQAVTSADRLLHGGQVISGGRGGARRRSDERFGRIAGGRVACRRVVVDTVGSVLSRE